MSDPANARKSKAKPWLLALVAVALVICAAGTIVAFSQSGTPTAVATPPPNSEICRITGGGTYYLLVTSAMDHNFTACSSGTLYTGTIDTLLTDGTGVDRRCILDNNAVKKYDAVIGVYSDTTAVNLAAADAFCAANGGIQ